MKYAVIQDIFVCLWNIPLLCVINYKLLWKYVVPRGKTEVV